MDGMEWDGMGWNGMEWDEEREVWLLIRGGH